MISVSRLVQALFLVCLASLPVLSVEFRMIAPPDIEHGDYEARLLRLALDHLDGEHVLIFVPAMGSQERELRTLAAGLAQYNVHYSGYSTQREAILKLVPIPLTRGLLGHRVFVIRPDFPAGINTVRSLEAFARQVPLATGASWPDRYILQTAGFSVLAGGSVWELLDRGRVAAVPMGVDEVLPHLAALDKAGTYSTAFAVHPRHMVAYRYDSFFYVAPDDLERAALIEEGLQRAYKSGAFMELFESFPPIAGGLRFIQENKPIIFNLDNAGLSETIRAIPDDYWHKFTP